MAGTRDASRTDELERLRIENEALSAVVGLVASSPDLDHVLARVVDLLTRVSACHACFVYLVIGDRLQLRAASPVYSRHVGRIEFGLDEGLTGWAARHGQAAFIRDHASEDPRTNFVPELDEDRFQSMAAVPVAARSGDTLGVIVLHTVAPHEFDEGILNVLTQTAAIIAGAIENAKLYEEARRRVDALTRLSALSQRIAAVTRRADLYAIALAGVRELLPCDRARLLELDAGGQLVIAAEDPAAAAPDGAFQGTAEVLLELLQSSTSAATVLRSVVGRALGAQTPPRAALALPIAAGDQLLGALVVGAEEPWQEPGDELVRAIAHQIAGALKKLELIEQLAEENSARALFTALEDRAWDEARARARRLGRDLDRPHLVVEARRPRGASFGAGDDARLERALRQARPGTVCDADSARVRALVPVAAADADACRAVAEALRGVATAHGVVLGCSAAKQGAGATRDALAEARDAVSVALALLGCAGVMAYDDLGAYRYLVAFVEDDGPRDRLREAVDELAAYDAVRGTQLLDTLEVFLAHARSQTTAARELAVHVNTLRQRLERIQALTGLDLPHEDLLALQIALKLGRLRVARSSAS